MCKLFTILAAFLVTASTFAQAPEKMSYQAVVRDSGNTIVSNQAVGMQISVLQTTAGGTAVYVETQTPTTNANGLVSIEIGMGSVVSGDFYTIDWSAGPYFIKTETDPTGGAAYTITGTSELLSVPYALHAKTVTQPIYTVNTFYAELGGYVIEISASGKHGLVVAMQDQNQNGGVRWYEADDMLNIAANHDINGSEFKDWRLPTIREVDLMYDIYISTNAANLSGMYWSTTGSNESNLDDYVFIRNFDFGNYFFEGKTWYQYNARAVRAF
ncbi:DUF1566 domain-containing protein [Psychroserpens jangbogonensis]|uniref:DUF1566 domain-containing protein n=1 Tax=Psychroserpens jangbogonensis TaxID=1484460 RepID=UPI0006897154|nr:DUF1566 domain-containing protein [Psychroserpens jangbogonensis]